MNNLLLFAAVAVESSSWSLISSCPTSNGKVQIEELPHANIDNQTFVFSSNTGYSGIRFVGETK
jgi:hypothetical protein